jgi:hypothetical protein
MSSCTDKSELPQLFPLSCESFLTRGIATGVVLRFKTFYLKVSDDDKDDSYIVQGFRYHEISPVFEEIVPVYFMPEFAEQFTREDSLKRYRKKTWVYE